MSCDSWIGAVLIGGLLLSGCGGETGEDRPVMATVAAAPAPEFALPDLNGRLVSLRDSHGRIRVVNFWATWCSPCRIEMPTLEQLQDEFDREKLLVLAVSVDEDTNAVASYIRRERYSFQVLLDRGGRTASRYGAQVYPFSLVIDQEGRVVDKITGMTDWASDDKIDYLRQLAR